MTHSANMARFNAALERYSANDQRDWPAHQRWPMRACLFSAAQVVAFDPVSADHRADLVRHLDVAARDLVLG
jgi:hypothetical protein